jgi:cyclopropane fatty-acyl-phospholipid synthase-like methyltransferase
MSTSRITSRAGRRQVGRRPAYSEHARSYDRDTGGAFQRYRRAIVEALPLRRGQVVLDVGCGTGLCCGMLREKVGPRETSSILRSRQRWRRWRASASHAKGGVTSRLCSRRPRRPRLR